MTDRGDGHTHEGGWEAFAGGEGGLIERAIRGDAEATQALWVACRRWVAAVCLAYMPKEADLDDLLQDIAVSFVRKVGTVRDAGAFKGWLRATTINAARAAGRTTERRKRLDPDVRRHRLSIAGDAQGDHLDPRREEADRILGLARSLPESYREPLLLRCLRGMSYRQIASVTGLPETTVETRIARGRRMLRELASGRGVTGAATKGASS